MLVHSLEPDRQFILISQPRTTLSPISSLFRLDLLIGSSALVQSTCLMVLTSGLFPFRSRTLLFATMRFKVFIITPEEIVVPSRTIWWPPFCWTVLITELFQKILS